MSGENWVFFLLLNSSSRSKSKLRKCVCCSQNIYYLVCGRVICIKRQQQQQQRNNSNCTRRYICVWCVRLTARVYEECVLCKHTETNRHIPKRPILETRERNENKLLLLRTIVKLFRRICVECQEWQILQYANVYSVGIQLCFSRIVVVVVPSHWAVCVCRCRCRHYVLMGSLSLTHSRVVHNVRLCVLMPVVAPFHSLSRTFRLARFSCQLASHSACLVRLCAM